MMSKEKIEFDIKCDNKQVLKYIKEVEKAIEKLNKAELKINIVSIESTRKWWKIW